MKIGIDARLWYETGVGRYIRNLVAELQHLDKKNNYVLFVGERAFDEIKINNKNWRIVKIDIHWHSLEEQVKFPQILYKEKLDLMHFPYFSLPIFYTKPFVVTIHDLIINHFPTGKASTLPYPIYRLKRVGYDFVMDHVVMNSKKIIVPLTAVKDDVVQTFTVSEEKVVVTYEGVGHLKPSNHAATEKQPYFLYVGNAYPHKNLEKLIEAFIAFRKEKKDIQLILVGKNDYFYNRLKQKVEKEKLRGIIFRQDVSDKELFALYAHAKAFISASLMEGFGLPPLEAMSMSCPIIVSNIPAFKEVCADAAYYFNPLNSDSLKEQMNLVFDLDHKTKEEKSKKGRERIKQFSWEKMARETLNVYENSL